MLRNQPPKGQSLWWCFGTPVQTLTLVSIRFIINVSEY